MVAVLLGHQEACPSTRHCCTCLLRPEVWLGLRREGHLSEGDRPGFSKDGVRPVPLAKGGCGTTARRAGRGHTDLLPSQSPVLGLSWL